VLLWTLLSILGICAEGMTGGGCEGAVVLILKASQLCDHKRLASWQMLDNSSERCVGKIDVERGKISSLTSVLFTLRPDKMPWTF
jgi:hypothetical protein